jgi:hypothetical protein
MYSYYSDYSAQRLARHERDVFCHLPGGQVIADTMALSPSFDTQARRMDGRCFSQPSGKLWPQTQPLVSLHKTVTIVIYGSLLSDPGI